MNGPAAPVSLESPAPYVALVTLRRPEARNAVNAALAQALERIVQATEADDALARLSGDGQARVMLTEDFREGPLAFIERRAPRWLGR